MKTIVNRNSNSKVNVSNTFIHRARCKFCGEPPREYKFNFDHFPSSCKDFLSNRKLFKVFLSILPLKGNPSNRKNLHYCKGVLFDRSASLQDQRRMESKVDILVTSVIQFLVCPCKKSVWSFKDFSNSKRDEIKNRKSQISRKVDKCFYLAYKA